MNKLYNTENDIVKGLIDFFYKIDFNFSKPQLKIIPHIISSIINSENITTLDISKSFIDDSLFLINLLLKKNFGDFLTILNLMVSLFLIVLLNLLLIILKLLNMIN